MLVHWLLYESLSLDIKKRNLVKALEVEGAIDGVGIGALLEY